MMADESAAPDLYDDTPDALSRQMAHLTAEYGQNQAAKQIIASLIAPALRQIAIVADSQDTTIAQYLDLLALECPRQRADRNPSDAL